MATNAPNELQVSVIVPVWNNPGQLRTCLEALVNQSLPRTSYEIIVVDNGSTDGTVEVAKSFSGVRVLQELRPGSYVARNAAIKIAAGTYLAFTDSDCVPDRNWLANGMRRAVTHPNLGVLSGRIELFHEEKGGSDIYKHYEQLFSFPQDHTRANCATANWITPKAVFDRLGGFDEKVKSGGDKLMAVRIMEAGFSLEFAPDMIVKHPVRATMSALVNKRRRLAGGQWQKMNRRYRFPRALAWSAIEVVRRTRRIAAASDLSLGARAKVTLVVVCMGAISAGEYLRLLTGRSPVR